MRWFTLLLIGCVSVQSSAADINVPADHLTIQAAILAANTGDVVIVAPNTYPESIDFLGKAITVRSTDPNDPVVVMQTIIDGTGFDHVVQCVSGEGPDTVLSGFIITGGNANGASFPNRDGGGMLILNSSPTVMNCTFKGNASSNSGGGMSIFNSNAAVTNCLFSENSSMSGGGMYNQGSNTVITNCTFIDNVTDPGGGAGMFNRGGSPVVSDVLFTKNMAVGGGGGLVNFEFCSTTLVNCTFSGNSAVSGGAVFTFQNSSTPSMADSLFCNNTPDHISGEALVDDGGNIFSAYCPPPIPVPPSCPADINTDTNVNVTDLLALLAAWGACP